MLQLAEQRPAQDLQRFRLDHHETKYTSAFFAKRSGIAKTHPLSLNIEPLEQLGALRAKLQTSPQLCRLLFFPSLEGRRRATPPPPSTQRVVRPSSIFTTFPFFFSETIQTKVSWTVATLHDCSCPNHEHRGGCRRLMAASVSRAPLDMDLLRSSQRPHARALTIETDSLVVVVEREVG